MKTIRQEKIYIYGKHALMEALQNKPESLKKVFLASQEDKELVALIKEAKIPLEKFNGSDTGGIAGGVKHQGIVGLLAVERLMQTYDEFIKNLKITPDTCLVILGELQDPQNVGSIIRSAAAMGIAGVFVPEHNQAPITGAVVKVSAGMAFRVPLISIGNVNNLIHNLKEKGFWVYGLDGESKQAINDEDFEKPTVFVIGNEAHGIREKTQEHCDIMLRIPMHPQCESMNAAVSTAIALYAWSAKHPGALN